MRNLILILLFLSIPFIGKTQNDAGKNNQNKGANYSQEFDLDIELFGFGIAYKKRINKSILIGF